MQRAGCRKQGRLLKGSCLKEPGRLAARARRAVNQPSFWLLIYLHFGSEPGIIGLEKALKYTFTLCNWFRKSGIRGLVAPMESRLLLT